MRFLRGLAAAAALVVAGAAAAQGDTGLQGVASAGGIFGQGAMLYGAQAGVAFTLPDERFQIRYLVQYYGTGTYGVPIAGGCLTACPATSANNSIVGTAVGARFNVFNSDLAPYLVGTVGLYQSRFATYSTASPGDPLFATLRQQFLATGIGAGGGIGINVNAGFARLYGEVQVMYTTLYHGTNAPSFFVPVVVGIGF